MPSDVFLWLSERRRLFDFIKSNSLARTLASSFVAGETIESAIQQSHPLRSASDIEDLVTSGARVRLVKGAYAEPPELAFQEMKEVRSSYVDLMRRLLDGGTYPGIATHDERLIGQVSGTPRTMVYRRSALNFRCCTGSAGIFRKNSAARGSTCGATFPSAAIGIPI